MIKVSDFIFQHLVEKYGIKHCFLVTGGGAMHLNDSIGPTKGRLLPLLAKATIVHVVIWL